MPPPKQDSQIVRLTNCRLVIGNNLVKRDLWISGSTGKILDAQLEFFANNAIACESRDLGGRIVAPGFIEVQLNGCYGLDFSVPSGTYGEDLKEVSKKLIQTGVTSYVPTITSQRSVVYHKVRHEIQSSTCLTDLA